LVGFYFSQQAFHHLFHFCSMVIQLSNSLQSNPINLINLTTDTSCNLLIIRHGVWTDNWSYWLDAYNS
jgi:hypothetical protein